jgi:hypothetical protein
MVSVFGWPDPNTGFDQSDHALYTCYFIIIIIKLFLQITTHSRLLSQVNSRAIASAAGFTASQSRCISLQEFHTEQQFIKTLE